MAENGNHSRFIISSKVIYNVFCSLKMLNDCLRLLVKFAASLTPFQASNINLAHRIDQHSGGLSKAATKLNPTVDVELNFLRPMSNNQVKQFKLL